MTTAWPGLPGDAEAIPERPIRRKHEEERFGVEVKRRRVGRPRLDGLNIRKNNTNNHPSLMVHAPLGSCLTSRRTNRRGTVTSARTHLEDAPPSGVSCAMIRLGGYAAWREPGRQQADRTVEDAPERRWAGMPSRDRLEPA
jgi:hypothetical protein